MGKCCFNIIYWWKSSSRCDETKTRTFISGRVPRTGRIFTELWSTGRSVKLQGPRLSIKCLSGSGPWNPNLRKKKTEIAIHQQPCINSNAIHRPCIPHRSPANSLTSILAILFPLKYGQKNGIFHHPKFVLVLLLKMFPNVFDLGSRHSITWHMYASERQGVSKFFNKLLEVRILSCTLEQIYQTRHM